MKGNIPINKTQELHALLKKLFKKLIEKKHVRNYKGEKTIAYTDAADDIIQVAREKFNKIFDGQIEIQEEFFKALKQNCLTDIKNPDSVKFYITESNLRSLHKDSKKTVFKRRVGKNVANAFALYLGYLGWEDFLEKHKPKADNSHWFSKVTTKKNNPENTKLNEGIRKKKISFIVTSLLSVIFLFIVVYAILVNLEDNNNTRDSSKSTKAGILILRFANDESNWVQKEIKSTMIEELSEMKELKEFNIEVSDEIIDESIARSPHNKAREIADRHKNISIVVWGSIVSTKSGEKVKYHPRITITNSVKKEIPILDDYNLLYSIQQDLDLPENDLINKPISLSKFVFGCNYFFKGEHESAIKQFENIYDNSFPENINNGDLDYLLGLSYRGLISKDISDTRSYNQAVKYFKRCIRKQPEYVYAYYGLVVTYTLGKSYNEALYYADKAINLDTTKAISYDNKSLVFYMSGRFKEGITEVNKAINIDSTKLIFYEHRGMLYKRAGLYNKSASDLNKISEIKPSNFSVWSNLAYMQYKTNNYSLAKESYLKALELDPANYDCLNGIGGAYFKLKDYDNAERYFKKAINLQPMNVQAIGNIANMYLKSGKLAEAKIYAEKAFKIDSNFHYNRTNLSAIYSNLGKRAADSNNFQKGLYYYKLAINIDTSGSVNYEALSIIYSNLDSLSHAILYANKTLKKDPKAYKPTYEIGNSFYRRKDYKNALKYFHQALGINTEEPILVAIGISHFFMDNSDSAEFYYTKAIKLYSNSEKAWMGLCNIYMLKADTNNALYCLNQALIINPQNEVVKLGIENIKKR